MSRSCLLATLVACLLSADAAARTTKKTEARRLSDGRIEITLRLEFYGEGLPRQTALARGLVRWWCRGAQRHWNRAPAATIDGRSVRLRFAIEGRLRPAAGATAGWHQVEVVDLLREYRRQRRTGKSKLMDGYRSWARRGGARGKRRSACFANLLWPAVVAHELGHLLGLPDEYDKRAAQRERMRQSLRKNLEALRGGRMPSLMDVSWAPWARVEPRHVRAIRGNIDRYRWWRNRE